MESNTFFKQLCVNNRIVNFRLTRVISSSGHSIFVKVLDDQEQEVFLMDSKEGSWKIKMNSKVALWLLDFEPALSEAINDREFS